MLENSPLEKVKATGPCKAVLKHSPRRDLTPPSYQALDTFMTKNYLDLLLSSQVRSALSLSLSNCFQAQLIPFSIPGATFHDATSS